MQVNELSEAFAKTSCSCIEDWDYEQDDKVKVSYTLNRRLRIWWMKLKMKIYELIYWNIKYNFPLCIDLFWTLKLWNYSVKKLCKISCPVWIVDFTVWTEFVTICSANIFASHWIATFMRYIRRCYLYKIQPRLYTYNYNWGERPESVMVHRW